MTIPKKRTSKTKTKKRKNVWKKKASFEATKALSTAKFVIRKILTRPTEEF